MRERAGNAALEEVLANLQARPELYQVRTGIIPEKLAPLLGLAVGLAGPPPAPGPPGQNPYLKPYHPWEEGSIENRNGILRRYYPKKYDFALTSQKEIHKVVSRINSTPMKCLGYRTPAEVFAKCGGVALAG